MDDSELSPSEIEWIAHCSKRLKRRRAELSDTQAAGLAAELCRVWPALAPNDAADACLAPDATARIH
jgi:hypothetical protein